MALVCSVVVGLLRGGSLEHLDRLRLRGFWFYVAALFLQAALTIRSFGNLKTFIPIIYSTSFLLLLAGAYLDRHVPGMRLTFAGLVLNALVIVINGGKMPVSIDSILMSQQASQALTHVSFEDSSRLWLLGDIVRISLPSGHYLMFSPGDLLLAAGAFCVVQWFMLSPKAEAQTK